MAERIGYIRVNNPDEFPAAQIVGIPIDRLFSDVASGLARDKPGLNALLAHVKAGDLVIVETLNRFSRNSGHQRDIIRQLLDKGVSVEAVRPSETIRPGDALPPEIPWCRMSAR